MPSDTYNANVRVQDLSRHTDNLLNLLSYVKNKPKWEVVRDALDEYVENHKNDIMEKVNGTDRAAS